MPRCLDAPGRRPAVRGRGRPLGARRVAYVFASSTDGLDETERALRPIRGSLAGARYRSPIHGSTRPASGSARHLGVEGVAVAKSRPLCSSSSTRWRPRSG